MTGNHQPDPLRQKLDQIKINYEQRIYEHSHEREKHFAEIFRYVVENVMWEVLAQRKKELEKRNYIVNIGRHFPDNSDQMSFVKMELSPAPAFYTGDAPNEDTSIPVYEWLARPSARAGLIEILRHFHAVQRKGGAWRVTRTVRNWWYTDRIAADQLTTEYVESSIDKWAVSSMRHYVRHESRRFWLDNFHRIWGISAKIAPFFIIIIVIVTLSMAFLGLRILIIYALIIFMLLITRMWFRDKSQLYAGFRKVVSSLIYDPVTIIMLESILLMYIVYIASNLFLSLYAQILAIIGIAISIFSGTIFYIRSFWENHVAWLAWKFLAFLVSIAIIPLSRALAGAAIERTTALSAESISTAWDIIALLYTIPIIFALIFILSLAVYIVVMFFIAIEKFTIREMLFISLIFISAIPAVRYTERWLLQFADDIIVFTFVKNCQVTIKESAQNCICQGLPEDAYVHFYEGNNVVEGRLRNEFFSSNGDFSKKYDFNQVGDGKSLECAGVSMW